METWSIKIIGLEMTLVEEKAIRAGRKLISASQVICNREDESYLFTFFFLSYGLFIISLVETAAITSR